MLSWLKKHLIPSEGNDHRPHLLRDHNVRNIVAVVIALELVVFMMPILTKINFTGQMAAVLPAVLSELTNAERQSQKLGTLKENALLNKAAALKAADMATYGYFAHTSPAGKTPWYWLNQVGYQYQYAGENLAINFSDSKDVTNAWMKSPTHKANIVKENYTEIGTGIATGIYQGQETVFVAQVYANPLFQIVPQPVVKNVEKTSVPDSQIAVDDTEDREVVIREEQVSVLGTEVVTENEITPIPASPAPSPTSLQKAFASPRNTMNIVLFAVLGIVVLALLLNIFIKIEHHHPDLITNGLVAISIIGAIFLVNRYYIYSNMVITQSLDYAITSS